MAAARSSAVRRTLRVPIIRNDGNYIVEGAEGPEGGKEEEDEWMLGGRREKRLKSLQMRGRKEMKDLDKSALSRVCSEIKKRCFVLVKRRALILNTIKSHWKMKQASLIDICGHGRTRRQKTDRVHGREKLN